MIENLINLVRQHADKLQHPSITPDRKEEAVKVASTSIVDSFQSILSTGGVKKVMELFNDKSLNLSSNPVAQEISTKFASGFSSAFGMDKQQAAGLASSFLPGVLNEFISKTNDPSDKSFDMQEMFNQFSEGKTSKFNIASMFNKVKAGLDKDGDGDVDLQDLKGMFTGSNSIVDKIKNVFK